MSGRVPEGTQQIGFEAMASADVNRIGGLPPEVAQDVVEGSLECRPTSTTKPQAIAEDDSHVTDNIDSTGRHTDPPVLLGVQAFNVDLQDGGVPKWLPAVPRRDDGSMHLALARRRGGVSIGNDSSTCYKYKRHKLTTYCLSQKGHDLTIALCSIVVMVVTMIGFALIFSNVIGSKAVDIKIIEWFFISLQCMSTMAIWLLLLLASLGRLTNDDHYRDQTETNFLRGGIVCLATGGVIYYMVDGASHILEPVECLTAEGMVIPIVAIIFTCSQMAFILKYSRLRINKCLFLSVMSRFMLVLIIATNVCVWINTVVYESREEIAKLEKEEKDKPARLNGTSVSQDTFFTDAPTDYDAALLSQLDTSEENVTDICKYADTLQHKIQPYTWPLLIEFCVVASICILAIFERCGQVVDVQCSDGRLCEEQRPPSLNSYDIDAISFDEGNADSRNGPIQHIDSHDKKLRYYNNQIGFLVGWMLVALSFLIVILYLYTINAGHSNRHEGLEAMVYGINMSISIICLLTIPVTMWQMSALIFRDEMQLAKEGGDAVHNNGANNLAVKISKKGSLVRAMDRQLLFATTVFHFIFHVMSIIAAINCQAYLILASSIASILMVCVQTLFINWYAGQKRSTTEADLRRKPGRQGLELLRCGNFALWLTNTFLVKHPSSKRVHNEAFGVITWAVVSNMCLPLLILYYFHSFCCIAEIISHCYTEEYIGIKRPLKLPQTLLEMQVNVGKVSGDRVCNCDSRNTDSQTVLALCPVRDVSCAERDGEINQSINSSVL